MQNINIHLKHQNPLYIKAHQATLNATALDNGYAELMYRADILGYKESFVSFCHTNHYQVVKDSLVNGRVAKWSCEGLQNPSHQFKSGSGLQSTITAFSLSPESECNTLSNYEEGE